MYQTPKFASLLKIVLGILFSVVAGTAAADGVAVVPGKTNGYFYDIGSNLPDAGKEVSVIVKKEGHFKEYLIESLDGALRCDRTCQETSQRLPAGSVTLRIVGKKPVSFMDIPLAGIWSEPCNNTHTETAECVFNLHELSGTVSVEVSPDIEVGTAIALPEGDEALVVKVDAREGYILVAAHERLGSNKRWLQFSSIRTRRLNINSPTDGRINTEKLLAFPRPSEAARHCSQLDGAGWYLPAEKELALMTKSALEKISGLEEEGYLWSSTERDLAKCTEKCGSRRNSDSRPYLELSVKVLSIKNASMTWDTVYKYRQDPDGSWKEERTNKYQALCFRRLAI